MKRDRWLSLSVALLAAVVVIIVLYGVVFAPTSIGSPASESDALVRANERLLEMVKWTVSTILLIGGGIIGLNWYQASQRYQDDREYLRSQVEEARVIKADIDAATREFVAAQGEVSIRHHDAADAGDRTARDAGASIERGGVSEAGRITEADLDDLYQYDYLSPYARYVMRFQRPNPTKPMRPQKEAALRGIHELLQDALRREEPFEPMLAAGVNDVFSILPIADREFPELSVEIRRHLYELGIDHFEIGPPAPSRHDRPL